MCLASGGLDGCETHAATERRRTFLQNHRRKAPHACLQKALDGRAALATCVSASRVHREGKHFWRAVRLAAQVAFTALPASRRCDASRRRSPRWFYAARLSIAQAK